MTDVSDLLRPLVEAESPSSDAEAVARSHRTLAELADPVLGPHETLGPEGGPSTLLWHRGVSDDPRRVLLLGHVDTVWPLGTLARRPYAVTDGIARGPGVFDMKAGLAMGLLALADLDRDLPVSLMVTGDEEVGSAASREAILAEAARAQACLVLEGAGPEGAVKSARKGWSFYTLHAHGRAAHAGLEPERGRNAVVGLAGLVAEVAALGDPGSGLSVTPTVMQGGTTVNTVPDQASLRVDVRCVEHGQQTRVDELLHSLATVLPSGVRIEVEGGPNRPPMTPDAAAPLVARLGPIAEGLGLGPVTDVAVGGISDANLTAAAGVPTLDGLGAVGGGAHADDEWVDLALSQERVALLGALVADLVATPLLPTPTPPGGSR